MKILNIHLPAALTVSFYIDSPTKGTDEGMERVRRQGTVTDNCVQHLEACQHHLLRVATRAKGTRIPGNTPFHTLVCLKTLHMKNRKSWEKLTMPFFPSNCTVVHLHDTVLQNYTAYYSGSRLCTEF
jgi:hypothetical protein